MNIDIHGRFGIFLRYMVVLIIIVAVLIPVKIVTEKKTVGYEAPPPAVFVSKPMLRTIQETVTLSGYIEADAMIPVIPLVSGIIMEYPVQVGRLVKEGDVLALIDEEPFKQQMLQAKAAYSGYQSSYVRVKGLYESGAVTRQEYDSITAQRDAAKAQYDLAQLQLSYASVKAPVAGTVLMAPLAVGEIANQQQPIAVIADLNNLIVRLQVPEKYFSLLSSSQDSFAARIIRPGSEGISEDIISSAVIQSVSPYIDAKSKMFEVVCRLQDNIENFRPGMYVKTELIYHTYTSVPVLPITALRADGSCFIYDTDNLTVHRIEFTNLVSDTQWCMVPSSLSEEFFVISGQNQIYDGQKVTVLEQTTNASLFPDVNGEI